MLYDEMKIIKEGTWLYDNSLPLKVQILKSQVLYGSGDYEDPPEIQNDLEVECYYVRYESTSKKDYYNAGSGGFLTLKEAMTEVERNTNHTVTWCEE